MTLSIVVPVLNEAAQLPAMRAHWLALVQQGHELLLVDGGSTDATVALAHAAGLRVVHSPRGRALQMNAGTAQSHGSALLFLHADTRLPDCACELVLKALQTGRCWGRFDVRIEGASPVLRLVAAMMNLRSRCTGVATGDQAMFMTRQAFDAVGGFPEQPLMEDIEMSKRLLRQARPAGTAGAAGTAGTAGTAGPACLRAQALTSGRRWETRGVWRTVWLMWQLRFAYWRGASASALAQRYQ
jgi:rSAM/selenodomain-associated transferase 2